MDFVRKATKVRDWFISTAKKLSALATDALVATCSGPIVAVLTLDPFWTIAAMAGSIILHRGVRYLVIERKELGRLDAQKDFEWKIETMEQIWMLSKTPEDEKKMLSSQLLEGPHNIETKKILEPGEPLQRWLGTPENDLEKKEESKP